MQVKRPLRLAHRWLGLLLGVQVTFWMASGVVMSWLDISTVGGELTAPLEVPAPLSARGYASPGGVIAQMGGDVVELRLRTIRGQLVYEAIGNEDRALFNPYTGERFPILDEAAARQAAKTAYVGGAEIERATLLREAPKEYRGATPVWRVEFAGGDRMRLYISPATGEVMARRNRLWRLYDFFWMLHIMDYGDRENFNNPLLKVAALTGLGFALSGSGLLAIRFWPRRRVQRRVDRPDGK